MIKKLMLWRRLYLTPVAPLYLICAVGGTGLLVLSFYIRNPLLGLFALILVGIPFVVAFSGAIFYRGRNDALYFGYLNSYRLTDRELTYMLGRAIPVFHVSLAEIQSVQPWRGVAPASAGSNEWRSWWFLSSQFWFWPTSFRYMLKKMTSAQALKCEYTLSCESGWVIVITCSRDFINRIAAGAKRARSAGGTSAEANPKPISAS